jgi:hypothetical protein
MRDHAYLRYFKPRCAKSQGRPLPLFKPDKRQMCIINRCFPQRRIRGVPRISLAGDRHGLFVVVKQDVRRGRLHAKLTQHADDLAAV